MAKRGRAFQKEEAGCIKALENKLLIHPAFLGFPLIHLANHCCNIFQIAYCTAVIIGDLSFNHFTNYTCIN